MFFYQAVLYGSWLVFPFLLGMIWAACATKRRKWIPLLLAVLSIVFIYARFVEPQIIRVVEQEAEGFGFEGRVVLIADTHNGLFKGQEFLERVVREVNELDADLVLYAGDFVFLMPEDEVDDYFDVLTEIEAPLYAVLGNHDLGPLGEFHKEDIYAALEPIEMIDNRIVEVKIGDDAVKLVGFGDLWARDAQVSLANNLREEENVILMAHNPDTFHWLNNFEADLAVAGHTHGGQIRIPFIYKAAIPSRFGYDRGRYELEGMPIYVTSGLGEVNLPLRFMVPPEIVVLDLKN